MNIALIGYGYWGPNIARNLNNTKKANLYAICDKSEKNLEKAKSIYGESIKYYTDYTKLLKDENVDAFALALRHDISFGIAKDILNNKKHLFIEKPLATDVKSVNELGKLSEENKVVLHTDHIMLFNPFIKYIKKMVENGEIGELLFFDSSRMNLGPHIKNDINAMWDLAVHDLSILDYLTNGIIPKKINASGLSHYSQKEELTYLTLGYENFVAFIQSSWISPLKARTMVVAGTKKMIVFDDMKVDDKLTIYEKGFDLKDDFNEYGQYEVKERTGDIYIPYIKQEDSLLNSIEHFIDCINENKESISNYKQAYRVIDILQKADDLMK